jgi:hypothetical protein
MAGEGGCPRLVERHLASCVLIPLGVGRGQGEDGMPLTKGIPHFNKRLGLGITPGEPGLLQLVGAAAPPFAPGDRPAGDHAAIRRRVEGRKPIGGSCRIAMGKDVRGSGQFRCRIGSRLWLDRHGRFLVLQQQGEPSLDTPNSRPASASLQGPKIAHGITPNVLPGRLSPRSIRSSLHILYRSFFGYGVVIVYSYSENSLFSPYFYSRLSRLRIQRCPNSTQRRELVTRR